MGWFPLTCFPDCWSVLLQPLICCWFPLLCFLFQLLSSSVLIGSFFNIFCLCKFSLSPSLPPLTVVTILMTIILNTLSGKFLSCHLVLFLTFLSFALVCKNSFLFSFCLCVCLYALGRSAPAPVLERVGLCRRCPVGHLPWLGLHGSTLAAVGSWYAGNGSPEVKPLCTVARSS